MFDTLLFDLDGTLTNPFMGITGGVTHALKNLGYKAPKREELVSFIGPPLFDEFTRRFSMTEEEAKKAVLLYREYYSAGGLFENELMEGAKELLSELKRRGKTVCLATSKPEPFSRKILEHFGVIEYFDFIGAATFDGTINTKEQVIAHVLEKTGALPESSLMVGDRLYDIVGAHKFGIKCACVLCGFGSREEFTEYGADYVCEGLLDILEIIFGR